MQLTTGYHQHAAISSTVKHMVYPDWDEVIDSSPDSYELNRMNG